VGKSLPSLFMIRKISFDGSEQKGVTHFNLMT
jgi:hypothetical protein